MFSVGLWTPSCSPSAGRFPRVCVQDRERHSCSPCDAFLLRTLILVDQGPTLMPSLNLVYCLRSPSSKCRTSQLTPGCTCLVGRSGRRVTGGPGRWTLGTEEGDCIPLGSGHQKGTIQTGMFLVPQPGYCQLLPLEGPCSLTSRAGPALLYRGPGISRGHQGKGELTMLTTALGAGRPACDPVCHSGLHYSGHSDFISAADRCMALQYRRGLIWVSMSSELQLIK